MAIIERVDVFPLRLPIKQTFTFASGSAGAAGQGAPHVLVRVTDADGRAGWGEGRPVQQWSYETLETVASTVRNHLGPAVIGLEATDRVNLHAKMHGAIGRGPSTGQPIAKAALDIAVHDLAARTLGLPLRAYLGGSAAPRTLPLSFTLTGHTVDQVREQMSAAQAEGFVHFNFKAAVDPATDRAVAAAIREQAGPDAFVWADANQGYALHAARDAAAAFRDVGVDVLEQPLPADRPGLMRRLRDQTRIALAVDEATVSPGDFFAYAAEGLVDYLVIKVTRSGGLWPTLAQILTAEAAGLRLLVSGLTDGMIVKLAALQAAAAFGYDGPSALNGSQFTDDNVVFPTKSEVESGGSVTLPDTPGIGIEPDTDALAQYVDPSV